ncbi:Tyrosine recombinase XerD [Sporomusa carbonis]|uniref:site-specific integrase n=1 Tax=Sporomusa carbonis TaxID=3076075 RepID=UPI003A65B97E
MEYVEPIRDRCKIEAMKRYLKGKNLRDYVLFTLGINSGLRISDLLQLQITDIFDQKGKVKDRLELKEQKTGKTKEFPIAPPARKALEEYISAKQPDHWLFPSRKSAGPLDRRQAWRILSEAAAAVGIPGRIGTHTLRKTFGYWAFKQGVDITRIQKLLNHSSPGITLAYIGITKDELDAVYINLNL